MRSFLQNKLLRDKAISLLENEGSKIHWVRLDDEAFDIPKQLEKAGI